MSRDQEPAPLATPLPLPPLRSAIIGGGFMGGVHARSIRAAGGVVDALASSTPERARESAARVGARRAAPLEEVLSDPAIDVVHVCTPNALHVPISLAAISAGKHVICEKPIGVDAADARALADAAHLSGLRVTVPFVYRFHPMVREARARAATGGIGEMTTISGRYLQDWLLRAQDTNWRVDAQVSGASRAFADIGSHLVDLTEFVTGERIVRLTARTRTVHRSRNGSPVETEDIAALLIETASGALGTLLVSQLAPGHKNALELEASGTDATVHFRQEEPESLWIGRRSGSELLRRDPVMLSADAARLSTAPAGHPLGYMDAFAAFIADSYSAIATGVSPPGLPDVDDGVRAAELTDAVLESAREGTWVDTR